MLTKKQFFIGVYDVTDYLMLTFEFGLVAWFSLMVDGIGDDMHIDINTQISDIDFGYTGS